MGLPDGNRITVERTLRPLRVGYRLDPQSPDHLRRAVETATMHWGGRFHAFVPVLQRRPSWWRWPAPGGPTAHELAHDYEQGFDCDVVVDASGAAAAESSHRGVDLRKLREANQWSMVGAGVHVGAAYDWLWRDEFRFESRQRAQPILPKPASADMALFTDVCLGAFPEDRPDVEERYRRLFEPEEVSIGPEELVGLFSLTETQRMLSPLDVGAWGLRWVPRSHTTVVLMLVDPRRPLDLFDFWNVRASGHPAVPVPWEWLEDVLPGLVARLAGKDDEPRLHPWVHVGRGLKEEVIAPLRERLKALGLQAVLVPPDDPSLNGGATAAEVDAERGDVEVTVHSGRVDVPLLDPPAMDRSYGGHPACMNTMTFRRWTLPRNGSITAFVPSMLGEVGKLLDAWGREWVRAGPFGLEVGVSFARDHFSMRPPSGRAVIEQVLRLHGLSPAASDAGTVAERLILQMGSLSEVALLRDVGLLRLMNRAATSGVAVQVSEDDPALRARVDFLKRDTVIAEITRGFGKKKAARIMQALVERNVLRAGLSLSCDACHFTNWVELDEIRPTLRFRRCLESYAFPQADLPDHRAWGYRPTGACSVEHFARGAYAVAHSLRVLDGASDSMVWCTGTDLGSRTEIDFAAYLQGSSLSGRPQLLLGEAKSLNEFQDKDFNTAKRLLRMLPHSTFVFATLRERLSRREQQAIGHLVRPPARSWKQVPMRPRVIVLTAMELTYNGGLTECWREASTSVAERFATIDRYERGDVAQWADFSLQIHVGLTAHFDWALTTRKRLIGRSRRR